MKIVNIKDKMEYLKEVLTLEHNEWAENPSEDFENRINRKIEKVTNKLELPNFCKLILLEGNELIGFISIFPKDCDNHLELTPWYATMFVKKEYRKKGYSKLLNDAILEEAKKRGYKKIYLKTTLNNYYEKFGAKVMENMPNGEKLMYFEL